MKLKFSRNWISLGVAVSALCIGYMSLAAPKKKKKAPNYDEKIIASMPATLQVEPKQERKLLIFSVTNGYRHSSIPAGIRAFTLLGEHTKAFTPVISDDLKNFEKEKLNEFDAVVFLNTTQNVLSPHPKVLKKMSAEEKQEALETEKRLQANLMEFIKGGKGFIGIHAATDTYYDWPEYGEMIGGYFDGHPWRHSMDVTIKVDPGKEKHPLVSHLNGESLAFKEEIYQHKDPYNSEKNNVILRLDTEKTSMEVAKIKRKDNDFGVTWIKSHGDGRVFYCSLGHNDFIYWDNDVLTHFLAGIQYALGDLEIE